MRAPDPTLSVPALFTSWDGEVYETWTDHDHCTLVWREEGPAIACVSTPTHFLRVHSMRYWHVAPLRHAVYVAVPCRECFPTAPPPGERPNDDWPAISKPDSGLAWQLG